MKLLKSSYYRIAATFLFVALAATALKAQSAKPDAPPFDVTSLDGRHFDLASLRGKVIVIEFWFTGCEPCVEEIPKLNGLVDEFENKGVVFIAPTWDQESVLRTFLKEHPFKFAIVPGAKDLVLNECKDSLGSVVVPTRLVIDKEGKIEFKGDGGFLTEGEGPKRFNDLRNAIVRLVNVPSAKRD